MDTILNMDYHLLLWIENNIKCNFLDSIMPHVSILTFVWIILGFGLLLNKHYRKYGVMVLLALLLGYFIGSGILKTLVARLRPFDSHNFGALLVSRPSGFSFPSTHTLLSFAAAFVAFKANKKLGIACYILALLIGFSRLYLFVHYPTDVLGGIIIGSLCGFFAVYLYNNFPPLHEFFRIFGHENKDERK